MHMETEHYRQACGASSGRITVFFRWVSYRKVCCSCWPFSIRARFGGVSDRGCARFARGWPGHELVEALSLRECLPEFIAGLRETNPFAQIISENLDVDTADGFRLAP